jgi:hypothetical protein
VGSKEAPSQNKIQRFWSRAMSEIISVEFNKTYQIERDMYKSIRDAIDKFSGQTSLVVALGVLELCKAELIQENQP